MVLSPSNNPSIHRINNQSPIENLKKLEKAIYPKAMGFHMLKIVPLTLQF